MTKQTVFENAAAEVQLKAQRIANCRTPEEAKEEYNIASGYVCALYDTKAFDRNMYSAACSVLRAAYRESLKNVQKETAPGAGNTESGKHNHINYSIAILHANVKRGGEMI